MVIRGLRSKVTPRPEIHISFTNECGRDSTNVFRNFVSIQSELLHA
jgi:hypothetical protein